MSYTFEQEKWKGIQERQLKCAKKLAERLQTSAALAREPSPGVTETIERNKDETVRAVYVLMARDDQGVLLRKLFVGDSLEPKALELLSGVILVREPLVLPEKPTIQDVTPFWELVEMTVEAVEKMLEN